MNQAPKYINKDKPEEIDDKNDLDNPSFESEGNDMGEGANDSWGEEFDGFGKEE